MSFSSHTLEAKPYNRCINCVNIGQKCDGPNFLAMSADRRSEWMRLRKEYLHSQEPDKWTNAYIADVSGVSKVTVSRIFSGDTKDIRISTIESILKVLVNGSWGQYPCAMDVEVEQVDNPALLQRAEAAEAECAQLRAMLESMTQGHKVEILDAHASERRKIDHLIKEMEFLEGELRTKDRLLNERRDFIRRKDRYILALAIMLFICLATIITALVIDSINPDLGFFWRSMFNAEQAGTFFDFEM